tara:strand:- start:418 stop:1218 length:801 start_codon:yes stop_codon:yes gene_type:complete
MPEAITIKDEQTSALSPENEELLQQELKGSPADISTEPAQEEKLLAGKYKDVSELEKAYEELQRKTSSPSEEEQSTAEITEGETPQDIYGKWVGDRFEEAGVDYVEMNSYFQDNGTLTEEHFSKLEEAGFGRDTVDAYLAGLEQKGKITQNQVNDIKEQYGGDTGYTQMMAWAAESLSDAEKEAFSLSLKSPNIEVIRLAVAGLHSKYAAVNGTEGKLIGGKTPTNTGERFESHAQLEAAMSDPLYSSDPAYRDKVIKKLGRSSIF